MSTGFDAITLLKAAPDPDQIAERLAGGPWRGIELCLMPGDVDSDERIEQKLPGRVRTPDVVLNVQAAVCEAREQDPGGEGIAPDVQRIDAALARIGGEAIGEGTAEARVLGVRERD